jgi:hypothetical protein
VLENPLQPSAPKGMEQGAVDLNAKRVMSRAARSRGRKRLRRNRGKP